MSEKNMTVTENTDGAIPVKANERPKHGPARMGGGHGGMGGTGEKAANFKVSAKRLVTQLRPQRAAIIGAIVMGVLSVALAAVGPKILGRATDLLLAGFIGQQLPSIITKEQAIAGAEAQGQGDMADMLRRLDFIPGQGIDFGAIGWVLLLVLGLYVVSFILSYGQGWVLNGAPSTRCGRRCRRR